MKRIIQALLCVFIVSCSTVPEFQGSTYKYVWKQVSWSEAKTLAEAEGGQLAIFETPDEQAYVESVVVPKTRIAWVGLTDEDTEGEWYWLNGTPVDPNMVGFLERGENLDSRDYGYILVQGGLGSRADLGFLPRGWDGKEAVDGFVIEFN